MANLDQQLKLYISADAGGLAAGLSKAQGAVSAFGAKVRSVFSGLSGLGSQLTALFATGALTAGIKRSIDALEELAVASKKTGVGVEELAKLRFAFEQADVPVESLNRGLRFLNRTLGEAQAGNEKAAESLARLGVSATDTALPAMIKIADAIQKIPNAAERATLLNDVFGKSWEDLVPALAEGGGEIARLGTELEKLGGVPSQKAADAADRLNDSLNKIGRSISGPLSIAIAEILPSIDGLATRLNNAAEQAGGVFKIFDQIGQRVGLSEYIRDASNSLEFWRRRLAELRQQEANGEFPFFGGPAKLYADLKTAQQAVAKFEKVVADARRKFSETMAETPAVDVLIQGDPNAAAQVSADAVAASKAAQAAVPPVVVPIAIGPVGAISDYAGLKQEFARQQTEGFASGGLIRGPGTSLSDSILARLSAGEFVVRAAAVKQYGLGFLERLNSMALPRFATGGPVGTPVNIYLPGGQSYGMTAQPSVAKQLAAVLSTEVLKRGRR